MHFPATTDENLVQNFLHTHSRTLMSSRMPSHTSHHTCPRSLMHTHTHTHTHTLCLIPRKITHPPSLTHAQTNTPLHLYTHVLSHVLSYSLSFPLSLSLSWLSLSLYFFHFPSMRLNVIIYFCFALILFYSSFTSFKLTVRE